MKLTQVQLKFNPRYFCIGLLWDSCLNWPIHEHRIIDLWICPIPFFPLHLKFVKEYLKVNE